LCRFENFDVAPETKKPANQRFAGFCFLVFSGFFDQKSHMRGASKGASGFPEH
jgi:hypothetical protein